MTAMARYAVFGPGHGACWLAYPGDPYGAGHIAYAGESREAAARVLAEEHARIARMRQEPQWRNILDTYALYVREDGGDWRLAGGGER